jgi:NAD(P)-dependent dehydrogenase (short-subunit alcohol dehydrogenase family)
MPWRKLRSHHVMTIKLTLGIFGKSPGAIYTPIQTDTRDARQMEGWGQGAGLGRPGEPSEVATSFVFLASADASLYCKC